MNIRKLTVAVREHEARGTELDVRRDARLACYDPLLDVGRQSVRALKAQEADDRRFFDQELIPLNGLLHSQVALADAEQSLETAAASARLARTRLNLLLGRPTGAPLALADIDAIPPLDPDLDALTAQALEGRLIMRAARPGLDTLKTAFRAAKSDYYPQVGAFAAYEQDGDNFAANGRVSRFHRHLSLVRPLAFRPPTGFQTASDI